MVIICFLHFVLHFDFILIPFLRLSSSIELLGAPLPIEKDWSAKKVIHSIYWYLEYILQEFAETLVHQFPSLQDTEEKLSLLSSSRVMKLIQQLLKLRYLEDWNCSFDFPIDLALGEDEEDDLNISHQRMKSHYAKNFVNLFANEWKEMGLRRKQNHEKPFLRRERNNHNNDQSAQHERKERDDRVKTFYDLLRATGSTSNEEEICISANGNQVRCRAEEKINFLDSLFLEKEKNDNELMILLVKFSDYFEEVLFFMSEFLIESSEEFHSNNPVRILSPISFLVSLFSSPQFFQYSLTVGLLHDWLYKFDRTALPN
jgi:hypothetical protein